MRQVFDNRTTHWTINICHYSKERVNPPLVLPLCPWICKQLVKHVKQYLYTSLKPVTIIHCSEINKIWKHEQKLLNELIMYLINISVYLIVQCRVRLA